MNTTQVNTTIEILGKPYSIRCEEHEVALLQQAAEYLHGVNKILSTAFAWEKLFLTVRCHGALSAV